LVGGFSDGLGESKIAALDLASNYDELGKFTREKLNEEFKTLGLELTKFVIENISLPQDVEAAMDKRTSMGVIGDVGKYAQFQAADAMRDAAQNTGGGAGTGAGLGAGFAIGNAMAGAMTDAMKQSKGTGASGVACPKCGASNVPGAKFCNECGATLAVAAQTVPCVKCGSPLQAGAKFCNECGTKQEKLTCANCKAELSAGTKFCNECGQQVQV
jgi:membrane protease subunit (stomatin/prohibitin family)